MLTGKGFMQKIVLVVVLAVAAYLFLYRGLTFDLDDIWPGGSDERDIVTAMEDRARNAYVKGEGTITQMLSDLEQEGVYQQFRVLVGNGKEVTIVRRGRIAALRDGDAISFKGRYHWDLDGGKVLWTYYDPKGRNIGGWVIHNGRMYQ
jgi:hypothetical protein